MIFYLWTNPGEINTAYVKLKKKIGREHFSIFRIVLEKNRIFMFFGYLYLKFQKNRSQKLSMLEQKQGQI